MWGALILKIAEPSLVPCVTLIRVSAQPRKLLGQRFDLAEVQPSRTGDQRP